MPSNFATIESEENSRLAKSFLVACGIYLVVATLIYFCSRFALTTPTAIIETPTLEAELVEKQEPKLFEKKSEAPIAQKSETSISKDLSKSPVSAQKLNDIMNAPNQTVASPATPALTRGPLVQYSPAPKLPSYLKNQNLKSSVLIEFLVSAKGSTIPSLIGTSGNEELDALALKTAKTWLFQPALQNGQAVDSKVRLRINFEIE
jgi:TonB family protein